MQSETINCPKQTRKDFHISTPLLNIPTMKITTNAGLANRLRIILGYREVCQKLGVRLTFVWLNNRFCGPLDNAFAIDGVTIEYATHPPADAVAIPGKVTFKDIVQIYGIDAKENVVLNAYRQIQFDPLLVEVAKVGKQAALAVHARVTDLYKSTGVQLTPSYFFDKIKDLPVKDYIFPVYLATDCRITQKAFTDHYGSSKVITTAILNPSSFRQSTVREAVVDLLACTYPKRFIDTPGSSFSGCVNIFRKFSYEWKL